MKIETLRDRIEKAKAKIEKKQNTIIKKTATIEKKKIALENEIDVYERRGIESDIEWLEDDIKRLGKEIAATKETLAKYEAQLTGEIAKEEILLKEIPEIFNSLRDDLVAEWDRWDIDRREELKKQYRELGYKKFFERNTRAGYEFMYKTEAQIHAANVQDAKLLILDLYYRVKGITGEVTDWTGIETEIGTHGFTVLNGIVIGKEGRAKVESIYAGGYNIQRLHVRVLVHSI